MKKFALLLTLLILGAPAFTDEQKPVQNFTDHKALISVQKQPHAKGRQYAKNNWFCIIIQCEGKALDNAKN